MRNWLLVLCFTYACSGNEKDNQDPRILDNPYTQIVLSHCDTQFDQQFTDSNTHYFSLSENQALNCFVFASSIVCGGSSGSCGEQIEVYLKNQTGYTIAYQNCGFELEKGMGFSEGIGRFTFKTREGYLIQVSYNNKQFREDTLMVNGIDYPLAKTLARELQLPVQDLSIDSASALYAKYMVWKEVFQLTKDKKLDLVTVNTPGTDYFLLENGQIIFHVSDVYSFEVASPAQGTYPALKVYDYGHVRQTKDTSYFEGSVYRYNDQLKYYQKK